MRCHSACRGLSTSLRAQRSNPFSLPLRHDGLLCCARNDGWTELRILAARCARGLLEVCPRTSEGAGNAGCRLAPAVSCARCTQECAHEHTGTAGAARHSLRNGFTAYAVLSPETNSSCLRRRRIDGPRRPVGLLQTSAGLTPATGARTTRFCRTQLPPPKTPTSQVPPTEAWRKRLSAVRLRAMSAHGRPPCEHLSRLTLPRPPQPAPTFVTMANAPRSNPLARWAN